MKGATPVCFIHPRKLFSHPGPGCTKLIYCGEVGKVHCWHHNMAIMAICCGPEPWPHHKFLAGASGPNIPFRPIPYHPVPSRCVPSCPFYPSYLSNLSNLFYVTLLSKTSLPSVLFGGIQIQLKSKVCSVESTNEPCICKVF